VRYLARAYYEKWAHRLGALIRRVEVALANLLVLLLDAVLPRAEVRDEAGYIRRVVPHIRLKCKRVELWRHGAPFELKLKWVFVLQGSKKKRKLKEKQKFDKIDSV
jgi:hypothetical protein